MNQGINKGIIYTLLSAMGYGSTAVFVVKAYQGGASPWQILLAQNTILLISLAGLVYLRRGQIMKLKRDWVILLINGLLGYTSCILCYTLALQYIPGSVATLTFFTYPILVALGAWLIFNEVLTLPKLLALLLAIVGVFLTSSALEGNTAGSLLLGISLCLAAALGVTYLCLVAQKLLVDNDPLDIALVQHFISSLAITAVIAGTGAAAWFGLPGFIWFWGLLLALCTSLLPSFFSLKGIYLLGAYKASIAATAEIPLTLLLVFAFLKESLSGLQWLGSGFIMASVLLIRKK